MLADRRALLLVAAGLAACAATPDAQSPSGTRLILLGVGGGPRPRAVNSASAQVVVVNDALYVIDCGDGVARQLVLAGQSLDQLRCVFLTHHHSDHNADYGNLLLLAWASGLRTPVGAWGPPPIEDMTRLFFEMNRTDIEARITDERRIPLQPLVAAHDIETGGVVLQDKNVKVTAALVNHPPMRHAFAYRVDAADRSIVVSGDTTPSDNLIALARGADVLVHEALMPAGVGRIVASNRNASRLRESILSHHTTAEDAGRVAAAAGVKMLVLSHFVPADDPEITDKMWLDAARTYFSGIIIVGRDLMVI
jgi:ribonuclease BN (tRNA processing enzyme)